MQVHTGMSPKQKLGATVAKLGTIHSIAVADVIEVLVGQQSAPFIKHAHRAALQKQELTAAHLSLTLVLLASLPSIPAETEDGGDAREVTPECAISRGGATNGRAW